jgi:hypothetical protein
VTKKDPNNHQVTCGKQISNEGGDSERENKGNVQGLQCFSSGSESVEK